MPLSRLNVNGLFNVTGSRGAGFSEIPEENRILSNKH